MTQQLLDDAVCYPMLLSLLPNFLLLVIVDTHPWVRSGLVTTEGRRFQEYLPADQAGEIFGALALEYVCGGGRLIGPDGLDILGLKRLRLDERDLPVAAGSIICVAVFLLLFVQWVNFTF